MADFSAAASSFVAWSRAATSYSSIANGVSGASAFVNGSVAIHASYAGWNSSRNRSTKKSATLSSPRRSASAHAMNVATSTCVWARERPSARAASIRMAFVRPAAAACSPFQRVAW